jgi:uncharacterized protein (TIGR03000 family)
VDKPPPPEDKPPLPPTDEKRGKPPVDEGGGKKINPSTRNTEPSPRTLITVRLPADARLFVDDVACPLASDTRTFETPGLKAGQAYSYTFRAEVTRNGQVVSTTQRVRFDAGKAVEVDLRAALGTAVAGR